MKTPLTANETRLKTPQRGWYHDKDPSFHGVKEKFDKAKGVSVTHEQIKQAAIHFVLSKFALLDEAGNPVEGFTEIIKNHDFGYGKRQVPLPIDKKDEAPVWSPKTGLGAGWTGDRFGAIANESYGGV